MAVVNGLVNSHVKAPLFSFGVITDIQYADINDGRSFQGVPRYYRHSALVLERAVSSWNEHKNIEFIVNLGDIVDGYCPRDKSVVAINKILEEFNKFDGPVYHIIGNHCLYNLPRNELIPLLKIPSDSEHAHYDFTPHPGYRFVVLDAYDISAVGWPHDHPINKEALQFLDSKNPNNNKNSPEGLHGVDRRFVKFNGAVGKTQLDWLDGVLRDAVLCQEKVIICCHLMLHPKAGSLECLAWNYDEVMAVVHRYDCVKACFAGHEHTGGYSVDSHGIHHRILEAALECPPGTNAFGRVDVYDDKLMLVGSDRMASTEMAFYKYP